MSRNPLMTQLTVIKNLVKDFGDPLFWFLSKQELHRLLKRHPVGNSNDIVTITKQYSGQGWYKRLGALQVEEEFRKLIDWASSKKPKRVIEIGTASGATLLMWSRIVRERIISIDLPGGIHGGGYPARKVKLFNQFIHDRPGVRIDLIRRSSHESCTKQMVVDMLAKEKIDPLFIDGDHRLEGVTRDFDLWKDLVRSGGSVIFHDIVPHTNINSCHVDVLWKGLKAQYPKQTTEIIASVDQGWAGIGILTL
jgi:predicted O-methyltransferase YrrM